MTSGYTSELGEQDKHSKNDIPCIERGWVCVPLVVEVFDGGEMRHKKLVAKKLAIRTDKSFLAWGLSINVLPHLGITLMHQNARALLRRTTSEVDISLV